MNQKAIVLMMVLVGLVSTPLLAQGRRTPGVRPGAAMMARQAELRAGEKVVTGAPYSAVAVTTRVQTLANGTKLTRKSEATIYRDSAGRIRREQAATRISPLGRDVEVPSTIFISDPVAGVTYTLYPDKKVGVKRTFKPRQAGQDDETPATSRRHGAARNMRGRAGMGGDRQEQDLGRQTIEGVEVVGKKTIATIPVDQIGNDQPIEIVNERWVSADLKTVVKSRHSDPRLGDNSFDLTRIDRAEPPASLFTVPEGYTITSAPGPVDGRRGVPRRR
ncbi:MAG: hypothetical protein ACK5RR_13600 [Acidobacteriota bacterium]|jgi:hypothetical protein